MIELKHIVREYNKKVVLNDISLTIEQGQSVAFTGHNGCGKSTLLKVIAGLVRPTKGTVCLEKGKLERMPAIYRVGVYIKSGRE